MPRRLAPTIVYMHGSIDLEERSAADVKPPYVLLGASFGGLLSYL